MAETELQLLKNELQEKGPQSVGAEFMNKQQENQILKLKEAVVKLRDINATDRMKMSEMARELEQVEHDLSDVRRINSKLNQQVDQYELQIGELHEQIDAALGAEEMVEKLTEKNLSLEEKVRELQEVVDDLEKLQDLNDELQDTARETEQDLREEVEAANAKVEKYIKRLYSYSDQPKKKRDHIHLPMIEVNCYCTHVTRQLGFALRPIRGIYIYIYIYIYI
ncbi:dynactin subunit 1-like, partial [Tropilaelaps mercedesae]